VAKETKFIEVKPSEVEAKIEFWQTFGWELVGAPQEIFNKTVRDGDSTTDSNGNRTTEIITETVHYVKVTFQRDKSMPNYDELSSLEQEFYSIKDAGGWGPDGPSEAERPYFGFGCLGCLTLVAGVFLALGSFGAFSEGQVGIGLPFLLIGGVLVVLSVFRRRSVIANGLADYSVRRANWEEGWKKQCATNEKNAARRREIIARAKSLLQ